MSVAYPSESIWLPGRGELRFNELQVARAVEEYDPDLTLGQIQETGQWAVFLPRSDGSQFPVFGLGHDLPSADRVKEILFSKDVRRNGRAILAEMEAAQLQAEAEFSSRVDEANQELAEAISSHMQDEGKHPFPKIYMGGRNKDKVRSA